MTTRINQKQGNLRSVPGLDVRSGPEYISLSIKYSVLPRFPGGGGGGYSQKNWVRVCGPLPKNPTLFMTKICDIPYPIYDLTKSSKPYL